MLNQVILVGRVVEIIGTMIRLETNSATVPVFCANLSLERVELGTTLGVKARLEFDNEEVYVTAEKMTFINMNREEE